MAGIGVSFSAIRSNRRGRVVGKQTQRFLNLYTEAYLTELKNWVAQYPPPVADSKYQRTYRLFNAWRIDNRSAPPGVRWELTNRATDKFGRTYAPLVHGTSGDAGRQLGLHYAHGWRNLADGMGHTYGRARFALGAQAVISRNVEFLTRFF